MARLKLILFVLILAASPQSALAQSDAAASSGIGQAVHRFTAWKLEAYRRRDIASQHSLQNSEFQDSILGYRVEAVNGERLTDPQQQGFWARCPEAHRNGRLLLSIELPLDHPQAISLQFYNRDNLLFLETAVLELHPGRMDIELPVLPQTEAGLDTNPVSIVLSVHNGNSATGITSLSLHGYCENYGEHLFADLQLAEYDFIPGRRVILR
jgi:hypothetical protein